MSEEEKTVEERLESLEAQVECLNTYGHIWAVKEGMEGIRPTQNHFLGEFERLYYCKMCTLQHWRPDPTIKSLPHGLLYDPDTERRPFGTICDLNKHIEAIEEKQGIKV
jgi:hypothetical protein